MWIGFKAKALGFVSERSVKFMGNKIQFTEIQNEKERE